MLFVFRSFGLVAGLFVLLNASAAPRAGALPLPQQPTPAKTDPPAVGPAEQILLDLIVKSDGSLTDKAFAKGEYKTVRAAFAKYFEARHGTAMRRALGDDAEPLFKWLDENLELKETLFTAIDTANEEPGKVMRVLRDLWKYDADAVKKNDELATAVSVVWDDPEAVYDYRRHQVRTRSIMPEGVTKVGALDNFKYVLDRQAKLKGPQLQLPWEFLIHVVNHRTPIDERDWAVNRYLKKRAKVGAIYDEVEYDDVMLQTGSRICKLNNKPYTLESILAHGGVCAMQADFAARVGKSLLVPAEYVGGEGNSGGRHAWVMWAEVKAVNKDAVTFTLESYGRYNIDHYYVGELADPQTGKEMTDRDLERKLTAVGNAPNGSRHSALLMRAYPLVCAAKEYTVEQRVAYLNKVLTLYQMCGPAWSELSALYKDGKITDAGAAMRRVDQAVMVFAKFPDYSWPLVANLLTPVKDKGYRTLTFTRVTASYENLGRPDLAAEARMKLVEYQVEAGEHKKAFDGLAFTVKKFPEEGRYVPKMTLKMQEVSKDFKGGDAAMAKFWVELLPKVPRARGNYISEYCVKLHEQAQAYLKERNNTKELAVVEQSLRNLKNGR